MVVFGVNLILRKIAVLCSAGGRMIVVPQQLSVPQHLWALDLRGCSSDLRV